MGDRIVVGLALALSLAGCVVVADLASHEVAPVAEAGADPDAGEVVPLNCDKAKDPKDEPCLLDVVVGAFVSPDGKDDNPGTRAAPTRTIGAAILKVGTRRRVFVCEGEYDELLTLVGGGTGHVSIYGGFECRGWSYSPTNTKPRVAPKLPGIPLRINGANDDIAIQDIAFIAHDATDFSASSIAAFVNQSAKVDFARVQLVAGAGKAGAEPPAATGGWIVPRESLVGNDATGSGAPYTPGFTKTCKCPVGQSQGGSGGYYNSAGDYGGATPYAPVDPANPDDTGQNANAICGANAPAHNGAPGLPGAAGVPATSHGALTAEGWIPSRAGNGASGNPGQGGGGGSGGNNAVNKGAGGSGGCGGCGGAGGAGATAGGASIAILIRQSKVALVDSELSATDAGAGGPGGRGEDSEAGWFGGQKSANGCNGGAGGTGASGAGGAGGHGGVSAGMLFPRNENPLPTWDSLPIDVSAPIVPRIRVGKAGDFGRGGVGGTPAQFANRGKQGPTGGDGSLGIAQPVIVVD